MAEISVAILGLKRTGASIGLALKRHNTKKSANSFHIEGYDTSPDVAKKAEEMGAVDKIDRHPEALVRDKDIVVITLPHGEVERAYEVIALSLRPGAVILDMSPLPIAALKFAKDNLPEDAHVVCVAPIVNHKYLFEGTDEVARASEDFFDNGTIYIMPSVRCIKEAITLATDFAAILGAEPKYYDPAEYDSLITATEALPSLLGVVLFHALNQSAGWSDIQRLTNPGFGMLTRYLFDTHPDDLRRLWLGSNATFLRYIDVMIEELRAFRTLIAEGNNDALASALENAATEYEAWINRRVKGQWDKDIRPRMPTKGEVMGNWFGRIPGLGQRDEKDDKEH